MFDRTRNVRNRTSAFFLTDPDLAGYVVISLAFTFVVALAMGTF